MADYWKSQAKKYCDFCKCWIADNKPSVEFHENGRRHKANVAKRLKQVAHKSRKDEQATISMGSALAQMEAAALEAYKKDVANNADLTSQALTGSLAKVPWREAKDSEGKPYYYNIKTNESVWKKPKEGYVSLKEQDDHDFGAKWKEFHEKQTASEALRKQEIEKELEEIRARNEREKLKNLRAKPMEEVVHAPLLEEGKTNPYGRWQVVQTVIHEEPEAEEIPLPGEEIQEDFYEEEEPVRVFKEKTIEKLDEPGPSEGVSFKKRKFNSANRKNARVRLDNDD